MIEEKDPVEDRDEFEKRVKGIFTNRNNYIEFIEALLEKDEEKKQKIIDIKAKEKAQIAHYIKKYDSCKNVKEKQALISSVTSSFEPTKEQIDAQRLIGV